MFKDLANLWKITLSICLGGCLNLFSSLASASQTTVKGGIDWIMVIDTSASMKGVGNTQNIFPTVQQTVTAFVNSSTVGDSITIYTFDRDVKFYEPITIRNNLDRGNLKKIIANLKANGNRTYTGKALQEALKYSAELSKSDQANSRTISIMLFTDGLEDVRGISQPIPIPNNLGLIKKQNCRPYLYFISLGQKEHEQKLEDFVQNPALCNKGKIIRDPGAKKLLDTGNSIRQTIKPPVVKITANPQQIDLGKIARGENSPPQNITLISNLDTAINLKLDQNDLVLISPLENINLKRNIPQSISLVLQVDKNAIKGKRKFDLLINNYQKYNQETTKINLDLEIISPLWIRILWLVSSLIIIGILIIIGLKILYFPGYLEGALEIIEPQLNNQEIYYIDLTKYKRQRLSLKKLLSGILLESFLSNQDAELFTIRLNGETKIMLRSRQGTVSINNLEIGMEQIYEGDQITLGNVKIRFINAPHYQRKLNNFEYDELS